jgi:hypothetical protein
MPTPGLVLEDSVEGAILTIHVRPRASRTEYLGLHGGVFTFRVAAPPSDGLANATLCSFLAQQFGLPKTAVVVCSGFRSRTKRVLLRGVTCQRVREVLGIAG